MKSTLIFIYFIIFASLSIFIDSCDKDNLRPRKFDSSDIPNLKKLFNYQIDKHSISNSPNNILSSRTDPNSVQDTTLQVDWTDYRTYYHSGLQVELIEFRV